MAEIANKLLNGLEPKPLLTDKDLEKINKDEVEPSNDMPDNKPVQKPSENKKPEISSNEETLVQPEQPVIDNSQTTGQDKSEESINSEISNQPQELEKPSIDSTPEITDTPQVPIESGEDTTPPNNYEDEDSGVENDEDTLDNNLEDDMQQDITNNDE